MLLGLALVTPQRSLVTCASGNVLFMICRAVGVPDDVLDGSLGGVLDGVLNGILDLLPSDYSWLSSR